MRGALARTAAPWRLTRAIPGHWERGLRSSSRAIRARDAAAELEHSEVRQAVRAAVARLSDRQRMAVLLNKFEGLSYAEIGQVMQMTESAVKSLLSRARANLREYLEPYLNVF